jgi:hypothetical protein
LLFLEADTFFFVFFVVFLLSGTSLRFFEDDFLTGLEGAAEAVRGLLPGVGDCESFLGLVLVAVVFRGTDPVDDDVVCFVGLLRVKTDEVAVPFFLRFFNFSGRWRGSAGAFLFEAPCSDLPAMSLRLEPD